VILEDQQSTLSLFHDTGNQTPLTSTQQEGSAVQPSACAKGRYVVFSMLPRGEATNNRIWRMDAGGGNLRRITDGQSDHYPVCSPDGQWVYYLDRTTARLTSAPLDGGKPERLSERPDYGAVAISPDGKLAAFAATGNGKKELALVPVDSPRNAKLVEFQRTSAVVWGGPLHA